MKNKEFLYQIAKDYYHSNMRQQQIAEKLNISRVQVGKYLKKAEELGIIQVILVPPEDDNQKEQELTLWLKEHFSIDNVHLVKRLNLTEKEARRALSRLAMDWLKTHYDNQPFNMGLGWGRSVFHFTDNAEKDMDIKNRWNVMPLCGGTISLNDKFFNIYQLITKFSILLSTKVTPLYLPFFIEDQRNLSIKQSAEFQYVHNCWNKLDVAIFGVGNSFEHSPLFQCRNIDSQYLKEFAKRRICGDIMNHYFDIDGQYHKFDFSEQIIGIDFDQLKKVDTKIAIACGDHKVDVLIGGLRSGLIDVLFSDFRTLSLLKNQIDQGR